MSPEMALVIAQALLRYGPTIAHGIAELFTSKEHSLSDWEKLFAQVKSYDDLNAESVARVGSEVSPG